MKSLPPRGTPEQAKPAAATARTSSRRWNSGRAVGPRTALTAPELARLADALTAARNWHDLALLATGVDTMLRASDLLRLQVRDVATMSGDTSSSSSEAVGHVKIRTALIWRQQKTGANVTPTLTPFAREALQRWIAVSGKEAGDFLFTRSKTPGGGPISASTYRRVVKSWAETTALDPAEYSSHSIRRTKPIFMYRSGCPIADISKLLGHRSIDVTLHYLGITAEHLRNQALKYDVFAIPSPPPSPEAAHDPVKKKTPD